MSRKFLAAVLTAVLCLAVAIPALAANTFAFTVKTITLFEGESTLTELKREGSFDGDGELVYTSSKPEIATVEEDGTVTAVKQGTAVISAFLKRNGKRVGKTQLTVKVARRVKKVTLSTEGLAVFDAEDPAVFSLIQDATDYRIIVVPAGVTVNLSTTCTPENATNRNVTYETTDAGVAKIVNGKSLKGIQRGECDLVIASVQNPEVTEIFRVLVTQPVKKLQIEAPSKSVAAGSGLQLTAVYQPEDATIKGASWESRTPSVATVDENGYVTALKKGSVTITATATDGSKAGASIPLTVTQPVTSIEFTQNEYKVVAGRNNQAKVTVLPADASDKTVSWESSDESVATVLNGRITGRKAGTCVLTCTSNSNPEVTAETLVTVTQLVTKIDCLTPKDELSLLVGQSLQLEWDVQPDDATDKSLTFRSGQPRIIKVDSNGTVTALSRGSGTVIATAADGSGRQGSAKINVIQPVTGVNMQQSLYYVQRGWNTNIRAVVEPRNANNQKVYWSSENESIATVRSNGTSTGSVHGIANGTTTVSAYTEDGGYIATTKIRVGNFNAAVLIEDLDVNAKNEIKIVLRNMSDDIVLDNIHFRIECFDMEGNPMVCNKDGESTWFEGNYPYELAPRDRTVHGSFRFHNYDIREKLGAVILTVTSWRDIDGITWNIPDSEQVPRQWTRLFPNAYVQ